jgi:anti-anti-sigma factor
MLRIVAEHTADAAVLHCSGRIVAGSEVDILKDAVACEADKRLVMLDLAGVDAIDAHGLGLLAFLQTLGYALGFELELMNLTPRVEELLNLTRLDSVLEVARPERTGERSTAHAAA